MKPHAIPPAQIPIRSFVCPESGCKAQPFTRVGDLNRHSRRHDSVPGFNCPAVGCRRTGKQGFSREDKLTDHMLAGHEEDDLFLCTPCGVTFVRAEYGVHARNGISNYRTCPMPRCSFKVHVKPMYPHMVAEKMDMLRDHLLEKHDMQARSHFSNLLGQRGYDAQTGDIICPVCPPLCRFEKHADFENHFMQVHFWGPACMFHKVGDCTETCYGRDVISRLMRCTLAPDEVHQYRYAILRIWPDFMWCSVWEVIKYCSKRR
ncbi:hypothetical protein DE146DRAFT_651558 [Phaeosphaeria sp. MPI-PUGE-AT-0046c]|nr:hypothetical protein DE146DRAFT_651558 [Phaeosphaeria sp. MPI-PUGE-AT-0046c]